MIKTPEGLQKKYSVLLINSDVSPDLYKHFRKWLRYYLDFCQKYQQPYADENSLLLFLEKLKQKNQPADQRDQAQKAIQLYYSGLDQQNDPQTGIVQNRPGLSKIVLMRPAGHLIQNSRPIPGPRPWNL